MDGRLEWVGSLAPGPASSSRPLAYASEMCLAGASAEGDSLGRRIGSQLKGCSCLTRSPSDTFQEVGQMTNTRVSTWARAISPLLFTLVVALSSTGCTDARGGLGPTDVVSLLVVPCEPEPWNPCIGAPAAPGGTVFEGVSAKISFFFNESGYSGAYNRNGYAVSTILGNDNFEPLFSQGLPAKWIGVCWTTNPNCIPRNASTTERGRFSNIATLLRGSGDDACVEIGNVMSSRLLSESFGGRRAFFMFDKKIMGVDEEGNYGQLVGTAHFPGPLGDTLNGEMGIYSGQTPRDIEITMIHEAAHFVYYRDRHADPTWDAQNAAIYCMNVLNR